MFKSSMRVIKRFPGYARISRLLTMQNAKRRLKRFGNVRDIFTSYYKESYWKGGGDESVCGAGSTMENTEAVRRELPGLISRLGVVRFLDAPCGDYSWFNHVELGEGVKYIGGDIVNEMIARNRERYENEDTEFICLDIIHDEMPNVDLWMCRDSLFHFSNDDIFRTLVNFLKSDIKFLLTSIHYECARNINIPTGHWRALNLELPPFNLGKPILYIEDSQGKRLGLWDRKDVEQSIAAHIGNTN